MTHLTENTSVRRGDALDAPHRTVRVHRDLHGRKTVLIHILGRDLVVFSQLLQHFLRRDKASFAVRHRDRVDVSGLGKREPRALGGGNTGLNHLGNVAADRVVGQGRLIRAQRADLTVGYQAKLDQCLEAVADTKDKPIALIQKLHRGFRDRVVGEDGRDELTGTFRLISG